MKMDCKTNIKIKSNLNVEELKMDGMLSLLNKKETMDGVEWSGVEVEGIEVRIEIEKFFLQVKKIQNT